jgi:hypothetical protein
MVLAVATLLSPWGQIQLVKWDIAKLSRGNDQGTMRVIAGGLSSAGYPLQAAEVAARIENPIWKADALSAVARAAAQGGDASTATELLKQAAEVAARIDDPGAKADALSAVARAAAQGASASKNTELLKQAAEVAARIDEPSEKARALSAVAKAAAQLGHWRKARDYAAENVTNEGRAEALIAILQVWHGVENEAD